MARQFVGPERLAELLGVVRRTIDVWTADGLLPAVETDSSRRYEVAALDKALARAKHTFRQGAPSLSDLMSGAVTLIGVAEAARRLDITTHWASQLAALGRLEAFQIGSHYRVSAQSVAARLEAKDDEADITIKQFEHVTGGSRRTFYRLISEERLVRSPKAHRNRVTRESLLGLLAELLPERINPLDWLDDRLATDRPLLYMTDLAFTDKDRFRVQALAESGEVAYIKMAYHGSVSKKIKIDPQSMLAYLEKTAQPLITGQVARLFGVTSNAIPLWEKKYPGFLTCPVHAHNDGALYKDCMIAILPTYLSPKGASPLRWWRARMETDMPVVGVAEIGRMLGLSYRGVNKLIASGELYGLRTPSGLWVSSQGAVSNLRNPRRVAARQRRENGGKESAA